MYKQYKVSAIVEWAGVTKRRIKRDLIDYVFYEAIENYVIAKNINEAENLELERIRKSVSFTEKDIRERNKKGKKVIVTGTNALTEKFEWSKPFYGLANEIVINIVKVIEVQDFSKRTVETCMKYLTISQMKEMGW